MSFVLHYARGACSFAPHVVLEELGVPFEARRVDPVKGDNKSPQYLALNPLGHVPVLQHDDFVLTEAAAISTYLGDLHPDKKLTPAPGTQARARMQEWQGLLASALHIANREVNRPERFTVDPAGHEGIKAHGAAQFIKLAGVVDQRLGNGPWALGEQYSVADSYLQALFRMGSSRGVDYSPFANWSAHCKRMLERPAVQRAMNTEQITLTGAK